MILIETANKIVADTLRRAFASPLGTALVDVRAGDFDGAEFYLFCDDSTNRTKVLVNFFIPCYEKLMANGGNQMLQEVYGDMVDAAPASKEYNLSLTVDLEKYAGEAETVIEKVSLLKRNLLSCPLYSVLMEVRSKKVETSSIRIPFRGDEAVFIVPKPDGVTVVYSLKFKDRDDVELARLFLQELADSRKDLSLQNAPAVSFSWEKKPLELEQVSEVPDVLKEVGYISLVLFPRHFENDTKMWKTVDLIMNYRNYLHYHLKCLKAYLHIRMRRAVSSLLQVLNRAKIEKAEGSKKTISGKTFVKK